jgi:AcrR family transcriptional regulator
VCADVGGGESHRDAELASEDAQDRERLVAAVARAAGEYGYSALTVDQVVDYAGLPRAVFDLHFESKEQSLVAAQEAFLQRLRADVVQACEASQDWPRKVRAALEAVLASLAEASSLAKVFTVEAAASLAAAERQFAAFEEFAALLREGRRHYPDAAALPEAMERALVGGIASIVSGHLLMENPREIPALQPQLVELLLIPYVGKREARRVAAG